MPADSDTTQTYREVLLPNGWRVGRFAALEALAGVTHMVTTTEGLDPLHAREHPQEAARQAAEVLGLPGAAWMRQVHGRRVLSASAGGLAGEGDGLIANGASLALAARGADCPLILIADGCRGAVGVAHASWRGTVGRIAAELVLRMAAEFGSEPAELVAAICPSAGPCCYEVQNDVVGAALGSLGARAERYLSRRDGRTYFDLWRANRAELLRAGLTDAHIHTAGVCTICSGTRYPSHRRQGDAAGRLQAVIGMR